MTNHDRVRQMFFDSFLTTSAANFAAMEKQGKLKNLTKGELTYAASELIRLRNLWREMVGYNK